MRPPPLAASQQQVAGIADLFQPGLLWCRLFIRTNWSSSSLDSGIATSARCRSEIGRAYRRSPSHKIADTVGGQQSGVLALVAGGAEPAADGLAAQFPQPPQRSARSGGFLACAGSMPP